MEFKGVNINGKIWIFVRSGLNFEIIDDSEQVLHGLLTAPHLRQPLFISVIYAKSARAQRYQLWDKLRAIASDTAGRPWMIGGDFNTILHPCDREGSNTNRQTEMTDFAEMIEDCNLMDMGFDGAPFTWAKNSLFERLDRMLVSEAWTNVFETTRVTNLPRTASDHGPVLMRCKSTRTISVGKPFRFQNMWIRHPGFRELINKEWNQTTGANGLLNLQIKLSRLKKSLKEWNKEVFGNLHNNLSQAEEEVAVAQEAYETDPSPINRANINKHIAQYILLLKMEEDLWRQKASIRWLTDGDRNTKFYQSWVKQKRARLHIHSINVGDRTITEEEEVRGSAVRFYHELLAPGPMELVEPDLGGIQRLPDTTDHDGLIRSPSTEEVKRAVFDISGDSAPGPDGFTAMFYHRCWDIIGQDVTGAVGQFFSGAYLPRSITATSIVLLPKKDNPTSWTDFRPISLCNVSNKIITKILSSRLAPLLPHVISPNQSGFVKGRLLNDNVLLAQEMFHELHRCNPAPNVALKLDMAKAYDRVQWSFLIKILKRMGFPDAWLSMIERCVGSCWFSILVNGIPTGFFKSTRGLRQGDPISPALFVIAADYLSRALDKLILGKREMVYKSGRACTEVSHLAYADDILIFTQAAGEPLRRLKECLDEYSVVSGQKINLSKSNFYITEAHDEWATMIEMEGGFTRGTFPFLYLGVPIYKGAKRTDMFLFLRNKISRRISGWAHRHLSFGGRLTLIKSTLEAIPVHIFQAIEPTKGALHLLEQQIARFFWGSSNDRKRTHWIAWEQVCLPVDEGGLGIRRFEDVLRAFNIKLWWRFREQNSIWAVHMFSKYCKKRPPFATFTSSRNSPTWRRLTRAWPIAQPNIRWVIGDGKISFWDDIWLADKPLREICTDPRGNPMTRVADLWTNGQWDQAKLNRIQRRTGFPRQVVEEILTTPILKGSCDRPRWILSKSGNFALSATWDKIRAHGLVIPVLGDIWNRGLSKSMSIFMWRLISNRIPVDSKLQWRKMSLASKCQCCLHHPDSETLHHLFVKGEGAVRVWRFFDEWFEGVAEPLHLEDSIPTRLERWSKRIQQNSKTHLSRVIPCLILWFLWAERNHCRHNGVGFRAYSVVWQVQMHIQKLVESECISKKHWLGVNHPNPRARQTRTRNPHQRAIAVMWRPPDAAWLKLNISGSINLTTRQASGGGILRDQFGRFVSGFSTSLNAHSDLEVGLMAVAQGLGKAKETGQQIWVEMDSIQMVNLINSDALGPAQARHSLTRIRLLQQEGGCRFSFIHREGNKAAEFLAKKGLEVGSFHIVEGDSVPRLLRAIIRLEQEGIPNVRLDEED